MSQFSKGIINLQCKVSSKEGHMIIFTISSDPDLDKIILSDPASLNCIPGQVSHM